MNIDLDLAFKVIGVGFPLIGAIYTWIATRKKDVTQGFKDINERLNTGSKRMDQHDLDIQALAQTVAALPGKDDVHDLKLTLSDLGGDMKAMLVQTKSIIEGQQSLARTVRGHEEYLRKLNLPSKDS